MTLSQTREKAKLKRPDIKFTDTIQLVSNNQPRTLTVRVDPKAQELKKIIFKKSGATTWEALCPAL